MIIKIEWEQSYNWGTSYINADSIDEAMKMWKKRYNFGGVIVNAEQVSEIPRFYMSFPNGGRRNDINFNDYNPD